MPLYINSPYEFTSPCVIPNETEHYECIPKSSLGIMQSN